MATAKKEPEIESVKMDDGRIVDFPGKRRLNKEASADETFVYIRMDYRNGETRTFKAAHGQSDLNDPAQKFAVKAMCHGLEQKLGDEMSGIDLLEDAIEAVDQLMLRLEKFDWNQTATGGSGFAGASILARALVEVTGQTITAIREYLGSLDNKTKAALRLDPSVAPVIKRLEDERAARAAARGKSAPKVDTASVLAGLMANKAPAEGESAAA